MAHLSPDELKQWFERGQAADRDRVITHLADCDACRQSLSAMAMAATAEPETTPALTVADAVPHGYAARQPARAASGWSAWLRPAYGLAAAAAVVLAVVWLSTPARGPDDDAVRSAELLAMTPAGASNAIEFRWESPFEAARYRIMIRDSVGALVWTGEAPASPMAMPADARSRLIRDGSYTWQVAAVDGAGEVTAESKPVTFRYQP